MDVCETCDRELSSSAAAATAGSLHELGLSPTLSRLRPVAWFIAASSAAPGPGPVGGGEGEPLVRPGRVGPLPSSDGSFPEPGAGADDADDVRLPEAFAVSCRQ